MKFPIAVIVPTGIGAAVGGYAGDAGVLVKYLAGLADPVLTHPNVVNAAGFYEAPANVLYLEGYFLDQFFQAKLGFQTKNKPNRIGMIIDARCRPLLNLIENAVNATLMSTGLNFLGYVLTQVPLEMNFEAHAYGYGGQVDNISQLLIAAQALVKQGAEALAVITYMDLLEPDAGQSYLQGQGVDPIGALEAVISHYLASEIHLPVAHSPIFEPQIIQDVLDPRVAAEEISTTYLPCILKGLSHAPQIVPYSQSDLKREDLGAVLAPWNAMGGVPMLQALELGIPLILVRENQTQIQVTPQDLGWTQGFWEVENYWEAAGLIAAFKQGIDPQVLRRPYHSKFVPLAQN